MNTTTTSNHSVDNWELNYSPSQFASRAHAIFDKLPTPQYSLASLSQCEVVSVKCEELEQNANPSVPSTAIQYSAKWLHRDLSKWTKYNLQNVNENEMGSPVILKHRNDFIGVQNVPHPIFIPNNKLSMPTNNEQSQRVPPCVSIEQEDDVDDSIGSIIDCDVANSFKSLRKRKMKCTNAKEPSSDDQTSKPKIARNDQ